MIYNDFTEILHDRSMLVMSSTKKVIHLLSNEEHILLNLTHSYEIIISSYHKISFYIIYSLQLVFFFYFHLCFAPLLEEHLIMLTITFSLSILTTHFITFTLFNHFPLSFSTFFYIFLEEHLIMFIAYIFFDFVDHNSRF